MGLFDNMFTAKTPKRTLEATEAFAGILLAASACDGHVADHETEGLSTITNRMRLFAGMTQKRWDTMIEGLEKGLRREGSEALIERCVAALPEDLRDCAFANACEIIMADRDVEDEEKQFLDMLQKKLGIDADAAVTIVEVLIVKNKG